MQTKGVRSSAGFRIIVTERFGLTNAPFPILQIVFSMENDEGTWRWLVEPGIDETVSRGVVRVPERASLKPLTNDAVANSVDSVRRWYEARVSLV